MCNEESATPTAVGKATLDYSPCGRRATLDLANLVQDLYEATLVSEQKITRSSTVNVVVGVDFFRVPVELNVARVFSLEIAFFLLQVFDLVSQRLNE